MIITALFLIIGRPLQADASTVNIVVPALVGAIATLITAYMAYLVQKRQLQSQTASDSKTAAIAADKESWERIKELMKIQEEAMSKQAERTEKAEKEHHEEAQGWERERGAFLFELQRMNESLNKTNHELVVSQAEGNELREVLGIVRKESAAHKGEVDRLRGRVAELEAENHTLKSSTPASRGKI